MQHQLTVLRMAADDVEHLDGLLTAVGSGDAQAFVEMYATTISRMRATIRRVLLDAAHTEDVAQEVYLEIWRTAGRFDAGLSPAIAWMLRLAHARAVDRVRRLETSRRHEGGHPDRAAEPDRDLFGEIEDRIDAVRQIRAGLPRLSALQQQAVRLVYLEGHSNTAAADTLGISSAAFKSRLRDGVIALRHLLTAV